MSDTSYLVRRVISYGGMDHATQLWVLCEEEFVARSLSRVTYLPKPDGVCVLPGDNFEQILAVGSVTF
jgi:hypothetical protein